MYTLSHRHGIVSLKNEEIRNEVIIITYNDWSISPFEEPHALKKYIYVLEDLTAQDVDCFRRRFKYLVVIYNANSHGITVGSTCDKYHW